VLAAVHDVGVFVVCKDAFAHAAGCRSPTGWVPRDYFLPRTPLSVSGSVRACRKGVHAAATLDVTSL